MERAVVCCGRLAPLFTREKGRAKSLYSFCKVEQKLWACPVSKGTQAVQGSVHWKISTETNVREVVVQSRNIISAAPAAS